MNARILAAASGLVFLLAWLVGLFAAPSAPDQSDSAAKIAAYFADNERASMAQTALVDGLAGLAFVLFAFAVYAALRRSGARDSGSLLVLAAGLLASLCSLTQFVVGETLAYRAAHGGDAGNVKTLFTTLNDLDTVKLVSLAVFVGGASFLARRTALVPRWLSWAGLVLAPVLVLGGLAFPFESDALYAVLYIALPALLVWVAALATVIYRSGERLPSAQAEAA